MSCYSPISIRADNGHISVPCGKCAHCLNKRRQQWTLRLLQEMNVAETATFWTFTYSDEKLPKDGKLEKKEVQKAIKRLRQRNLKVSKKKIKYFLCGEYGEKTNRPHYHAIFFNVHESLNDEMDQIWENGNVFCGSVTQASIHYVTKYILKNLKGIKTINETFALMSKALGINYVEKYKKNHFSKEYDVSPDGVILGTKKLSYITMEGGFKMPIPRYYKEKMFSRVTREKMAKESQERMIKKSLKEMQDPDYVKNEKIQRKMRTKRASEQSKSKKV